MFSGIQEILVVIAIFAAIFFIPRMTGRSSATVPAGGRRRRSVTGRMRIAVVSSAMWIAAALLIWEPWSGHWQRFAVCGVFPVAAAWSIHWILAGFRPRRR